MFDVIAGGVALEKVSLATFLLLNVELHFIEAAMADERLHEVLGKDGAHHLRGHLEDLKHAAVQLGREDVVPGSLVFHLFLGALQFVRSCARRRILPVILRRLHPFNPILSSCLAG